MARDMVPCTGELLPGVAFGAHRFVVWRWAESPLGPVSALGRIGTEGRLTLHAASPAYADLLRAWHRVHDVRPGALHMRETNGATGTVLRITAEPLDAAPIELELDIARTLATRAFSFALGWTPPCVRESEVYVRAASPLAGPLLGVGRGRRFAGLTETGTPIVVATRAVRAISGGRASIGGADAGPLRPIDDPPDWGELRMPRLPYLFACRLRAHVRCPDLSRSRGGPS
jgi:hypothetical protein